MSEARAIAGGLKALFSKPRKLYVSLHALVLGDCLLKVRCFVQENVDSGTVYISSTPAEMVYIRACSNCELWGTTKLAKCIMGRCDCHSTCIHSHPLTPRSPNLSPPSLPTPSPPLSSLSLSLSRIMFQCEGGISGAHHEWHFGTYLTPPPPPPPHTHTPPRHTHKQPSTVKLIYAQNPNAIKHLITMYRN